MSVTIEQEIKEIERELFIRKLSYKKWIPVGKISKKDAIHRVACLEATLKRLKQIQVSHGEQVEMKFN